jgi:hypothetical protein
MLKPGANALVLSRFNSSALPWLYTGAALITGALALGGARGTGGKRRSPLFLSLAGGLIALACAGGVLLKVPMVALAAYLFSEAFATQVSLAFWGAMGEAFDPREARRAFTWINGVGMSGAIVGGFAAQWLAHSQGATALLVVGGALLLVGAGTFRFHVADVEVRVGPAPRPAGWREVLAMPYTQLLAAMVLGFALLQILIDFVFRERAVAQLVESDMAELFASHQLWTGVVCVAFQFVLAEQLLKRLGILRYVGLVPASLGVLAVVTWLVPSVWSAWALKVAEGAASWSVLPVAMQLLYAPLPDETRDGARRTVDGFLRKVGMGVAGVVLLAVAGLLGSSGVLVLVGLLCVALGVVLWWLRPRYVEAVHARVAGVQPEGVLNVEERLLLEALKSPTPERVLRAVDLLTHADAVKDEHVRLLLEHPHERVQERGVALADSLRVPSVARQLEAMVGAPARRPRDAAVWALARLNPDRAAVVLPPLLASSDIGLVTATIGGLLSLDEAQFPAANAALARLLGRGVAAPAAERREVARLLGRINVMPERTKGLQALLDDGDASVRRLAITSVGQGAYFELAPKLLRFLSWRDDRRIAREALALMGDDVVALLAATLDDRSRSLSLRLQLPRVLRRIATQTALDALLYSNAHDDPSLHYRVGVALAQVHEERPELVVDPQRLTAALDRRREAYVQLLRPWRDARAALGEASLLTRVLGDRLDQALELSFWLLGLRHDPRLLRRVHAHIVGSDRRRRAWALELVDNTLPDGDRALVSAQIETLHTAQLPGKADRFDDHLEVLTRSDDFVLRACARKVARLLGQWNEPNREDDMNDQTLRKLFALEGVEIFAQSDVDDLAAVAAVAKEHSFRRGETVYAEGDPGDALYVIIEGAVEALRDNEVVLTMHARECFGETSLFDGTPRINSVVAIADLKTLIIDRRDFLDLLGDRPELLTGMFRVLSRQLKTMVVEVAATRRATTGELPMITPESTAQK